MSKVQKPPSAIGATDFVQIIDVVKQFDDITVVDKVNLTVAKNEVFALLGSSGCGKSTLLRMMAGLEIPTSGRIIVDGQDITALPPHQRPVNMMFQSYALFPHMTVEENVSYGLKREGVKKNEIKERVMAVLDLVQMQKYAARKPHQLSGGQQQRAALARSLVKRPKLLLLDEPMSALDKKIRQKTQFELGNILYKVGVTCIMVTHDQEEAMTMADRLAVMSEGQIIQLGEPDEVYEFPNSKFAAEFIGSTNMFDGELVEDASPLVRCAEMPMPLELANPMNGRQGLAVQLSIRPERINMSFSASGQHTNCAEGVVDQVAYMGSYWLFYIRLVSGKLILVNCSAMALSQMDHRPNYNETVYLSWNCACLVVLRK